MSDIQESAEGPGEQRPESLTCFVIGPIGNKQAPTGSPDRLIWEEAIQVVEEVILPACAAVGLSPVRADGLARAGEIPDQVFRRLRNDDVVIADTTGANANVMYELGLRHTQNKLTVQIGEYGRLPFDLNVIRTVMFSRSAHGLVNARDELQAILEAGLAGEFDPVSATRVRNEAGSEETPNGLTPDGAEAVEESTSDPESEVPPGFLDLLADAEEGQEVVIKVAEEISRHLETMGQLAEESTRRMELSDTRSGGMRGRLALTVEFAAGLDSVAEDLSSDVDTYVAAMAAVSRGNIAIIHSLEEDPTQLDSAMDWAMVTRRLAETVRAALSELAGFTEIMKQNAKISRALRRPTDKIVDALEKFGSATEVADEWDRRLQGLGVPVPPPDWELDADGESETEAET